MHKDQNTDQSLQLAKLFPNMITLLALCAGLSAMRWSLDDRWSLAVSLILIAAVLDALDGRLARKLSATSTFGAQLDSLSDFINFGVAPAFILYMWQTHEIKGWGWAMVLFFAVCCAIRLARFNTDLVEENPPSWASNFFVGVPSPAGALMVLAPLMIALAFEGSFDDTYEALEFTTDPRFVIYYTALVAFLMVSRIPTFSFKKISIRNEYVSLILAAAGLLAIAFLNEPWVTLLALGTVYVLTIPISIVLYYKFSRGEKGG